MDKKLLITGYPKSGNTWAGFLLSYILNGKYVDLHNPDKNNDKRSWVNNLVNGNLNHKSFFTEIVKTHDLATNVNKLDQYSDIVLIIRDPRDICVSYYFYKYNFTPLLRGDNKRFNIKNNYFVKYFLWKKHLLKTAKEWAFHSNSWDANRPYIIKYEDLKKNPQDEIKKLLNCLRIEVNPQLIDTAIEEFAFEKLSRGRIAGEENRNDFFRKGIVGDYKNHFKKFDNWLFLKSISGTMKKFNYL